MVGVFGGIINFLSDDEITLYDEMPRGPGFVRSTSGGCVCTSRPAGCAHSGSFSCAFEYDRVPATTYRGV